MTLLYDLAWVVTPADLNKTSVVVVVVVVVAVVHSSVSSRTASGNL